MAKRIQSHYNGTLEVTMQRGRKVLHSKNTNYSYGNVQQVWSAGLKKLDLMHVQSILLLGLGGGSIIDILKNEYRYRGHLTAVEIDPVVVDIAKEEFGITTNEQTEIICDDAANYVSKTKDTFDLIIVDIFIDDVMPDILLSMKFWQNIAKRTMAKGTIAFNAFNSAAKLNAVKEELKCLGFEMKVYPRVNGSNTMLIATR
ncbi:MAG: spermidine synthase [Flavobacteriales bacterium]